MKKVYSGKSIYFSDLGDLSMKSPIQVYIDIDIGDFIDK